MTVLRRQGPRFWAAAGLIVTMLVAGCGGGGSNHVSVRSIRHAASVTAMSGLRMSIQVRGPSVVFSATGSFVPRKHAGAITMNMQAPQSGAAPAPMPVVIANGTIYERLPAELASRIPGGRPWLSLKLSQVSALSQLPGLDPFIKQSLTFADPGQYLDLLSAAEGGSVTELGHATVGGVRTTRYRTVIDLSKLPTAGSAADRPAAAQLASALKGRLSTNAMPVDVWIDRTNKIRRLQTMLPGNLGENHASISITENITGYGSQHIPPAPSAASTTNLLSLVAAFQPSSG